MSSYQQRRVEYEVLEYNQGSGGAFGGASGFSAVKGGGYGGGGAGGYGAGGAGAGYGSCSSGGYGACGGGYGAGGGGGFGAVGGGYGAAGGAYGAGGGGYGGGGYGTAVGGGGGGYSSGFGGATKYSTSGGFDCGSGGYSQAQMYKNEVQTMAAKTGGGGGGYSSGFGGATEYSTGGGFDCGSGGYSQTQMYKNEVQTMAAKTGYGAGGDPFCSLVPSSFPPGTDPKIIDCFNLIDKDRSGQICDKELMAALSSFDQSFSLRTVHLLMYMFTGSNSKELGPKEFVPLIRSLQTWKATFQKFDCDRNGRLDERELKDALMSMGFAVSPFVIKLVMSKYDKSGYKCAIEYDYFIECCVVVKGLTEKFRAKEDDRGCGVASFTYDEFLLSVLPFIVA